MISVRNKIKSLIATRCLTIKKLAEMMSEKTNKRYTFKSLTGKLQRGTLSLEEAYLIADLLEYNLEFIDKFK